MTNSTISDQLLMDKSMRSVFVRNIPYGATEENLKDIFSQVGPVLSFKLVYDKETGKPNGYGFCEYEDEEMVLNAIRNFDGYEMSGRKLCVDDACTEECRMELRSLLQGESTENPHDETEQTNTNTNNVGKNIAKGVIIGAAVGGAILAAPLVVTAAGFTSGGIAAGSLAASMMSTLGGGATAAGGVVATCQAIGATGTVLGSTAATLAAGATGAAVGVGVSEVVTNIGNKKETNREEERV